MPRFLLQLVTNPGVFLKNVKNPTLPPGRQEVGIFARENWVRQHQPGLLPVG
jgi:hypothetical protein